MCDELPLESEQLLVDILTFTLQQYIKHNHSSDHIVHIITLYVFCNEYYFCRDCHIIDIIDHTITFYLHKSKFCKNLFKLTCSIKGNEFLKYIESMIENIDKPNQMTAWIDTECKDDLFANSKSANMINNSYFLLMTYFEESRQIITPWLVQWKYDNNSMPYIQVIARIISYPSDWNYVTIRTEPNIGVIFYNSMEQHIIEFIDNKEYVKITKFGVGLFYPWLMYGSAATKILNYNDIMLLFRNETNEINISDKQCEYFVTRSRADFVEMRDEGSFWTESRHHISILEIKEKQNHINEEKESADFNVLIQIPIFDKIDDKRFNFNILDVTVTNEWSFNFQCKYGVKCNDMTFMILYTEIRYDLKTTQLYSAYINMRSGVVEMLKKTKLASSKCLTKFLVGRGSYQITMNDWMCTLIGVDENNHEVRHQLRLTEQLELLYYQRIKRNENVQQVTDRYKCKALKYFKRAKKEEIEMQRANQPPTTAQTVWRHVVASRHLILSTLVGAYIGYRVSRAIRNGQWTFSKFRY